MGLGSGLSCAVRLNSVLTAEQRERFQNREEIVRALNEFRTIAMVGLSADTQKSSYFVASYLKSAGYKVVPVNPKADIILGQKVYRTLADIPFPVDLVDIFRPAQECEALAAEAIAIGAKGFWQQLRITNLAAAELAKKAGLVSVVDLCFKMEHGRYSGGLHEAGMNTEVLSARRTHRFV